jgi:hypothetical protein
VILWALDLKKEMDCQSKIMEMKDHLFFCPDEAVMLIHGEYQCASLSESTHKTTSAVPKSTSSYLAPHIHLLGTNDGKNIILSICHLSQISNL